MNSLSLFCLFCTLLLAFLATSVDARSILEHHSTSNNRERRHVVKFVPTTAIKQIGKLAAKILPKLGLIAKLGKNDDENDPCPEMSEKLETRCGQDKDCDLGGKYREFCKGETTTEKGYCCRPKGSVFGEFFGA
jgi:hypothetical protein